MFFSLLTAVPKEPLFRSAETLPTSYIGYIFLVLMGLIIAYVAILLLLKKFGLIKPYGIQGKDKSLKVLHRSKLSQNTSLIHYQYMNKEYLIMDNGNHLLDLSNTLDNKKTD
ncbi:hypothetical protein [Kangiella sp. HZ709]|uniref:hypothetical protein n=1 Tax=Kangiella sp. HZ709 TaxID=2666328 RepID=UPI0012AFDB6C|nr:hypothetical protein [Kangiella sp. HZ709]MRX26841.1 hypothetical protein [Kangiella sp. HZ709]